MDAVMFSLKRAFHKSVEAGLRLTREFGLTPARFDLLYALETQPGDSGVRQSFLRSLLGVSAPTVSRMVTSLEKLGLVVRSRDAKGRSCGVMLTDAGKRRIGRAMHAIVQRGAARRMVRALWRRYAFPSSRAGLTEIQTRIQALVDELILVRRSLWDRAWLVYPNPAKSRAREGAEEVVRSS